MTHAHSLDYEAQLQATRAAFDSVAADYDGASGNNQLVQHMRQRLWQTALARFPRGGRLLDIGCGTGIDAAFFAGQGYQVLASDWSPRMVARTRERAVAAGLARRMTAIELGAQELPALDGEAFDGIYSDLGALNCAPDMAVVARACAALVRPGGTLIFSVIGRWCPWEIGYYLVKGQPRRALVRLNRAATPVGLNGNTVWTRYYTPRELYHDFQGAFSLDDCRALALFAPPPYLIGLQARAPRLVEYLARLDDRLGHLPLLRDAGDHFLITLTRR